ncbi:MAG: hypothetical protein J1G04_05325 [Clostridiales bacterium]|nr:hypothetical protein [Clostridiales bacterium]
MIDSEDKPIVQSSDYSSGNDGAQNDTAAPFSEPEKNTINHAPDVSPVSGDEAHNNDGGRGGVAELVGVGIKAIAVALSVVFLLLSILTVAMPLSAMRTFNRLGWSERALNSGDRYISRRIRQSGADGPDALGNYVGFVNANLDDDDMVEAYDVCIGLSRKLMDSTASDGDIKSAVYFAQKLERYTRQYMSIGGIIAVNNKKSAYSVENVPDIRMRPYVYDYAHTIMLDNFRARTYIGETNKMMYDSGRSGDCVINTITLANSYETGSIPENPQTAAQVIDGFVDYIDQLGEYLSIKFERLGVPALLNETVVRDYQYILDGTDFELFITPTGGYTEIYNKLKRAFSRYAQAAADFNTLSTDDELHKLYWLQALASASTKLWYMSMLLYYDRTGSYGASFNDIIDEYNKYTCEMYKFVDFDAGDGFGRKPIELSYVYNKHLQKYLAHFAA